MDNNQFVGSIPDSWWEGLSAFEEIYLYKNELSGSLSSNIGNMLNLVDIRVSRNRFDGTIPSEIGTLSRLRYIFIEDNKMTGAIPSEIGNLIDLEEMRLYGNEFIGIMPDSVCNLKSSATAKTAGSTVAMGGHLQFLASDCRGDTPEVQCNCCDNCRR
eukprot:1085778-Ditylum_brightwellii.AAC.1